MEERDDFAEVKASTSLIGFAEDHLKKIGRGLICPSCGSGTGPNKTPAFSVKGRMFKCFSCQVSGDVFDLAGMVGNTDSKIEQLSFVKSWLNRSSPPKAQTSKRADGQPPTARFSASRPATVLKEDSLDNPDALSYLSSRGFTLEEARSFGLGFDEKRKRIRIPYPGNPWYHIDRDVTGSAKAKYVKPSFDEAGPEPVFNPDAVKADHIFIVEGPFDYMAVKEAGFEAMALCGTSWRKAAEHIIESGYRGCVTIALDNDEPGRSSGNQMKDFLESAGVSAHIPEDPWSGCNDAAELHLLDRGSLTGRLTKAKSSCLDHVKLRKSEGYARALGNLRVLNPIEALRESIANDRAKVLATGMRKVDDALGGGFHTGNLYVVGAVSSLGKTTLCLQLADLLAKGGNEVLYVTLEQSAAELAAKSISRIMCSKGFEASSADVLRADRRNMWDEKHHRCFEISMETYEREISGKLRVIEGQERPNAKDVRLAAEAVSEKSGLPPVVFVDYLQLLSPFNEKSTDKQAADDNVRALKHLARDLNCPVIAISSLNRGSYSAGIDLSSWKESGLIEYSADVLIGMQLWNMVQNLPQSEKDSRRKASKLMEQAKSQRVRQVELVVLKNRSGAVIGSDSAVPLRYDALANAFT